MRRDPLTGVIFQPRRSNQKFASKINRLNFYNAKAKRKRIVISALKKPLNENYQILNDQLGNRKSINVELKILLELGFHYGLYSHMDNYYGSKQFAVFDILVIPQQNEKLLIIRNIHKNLAIKKMFKIE